MSTVRIPDEFYIEDLLLPDVEPLEGFFWTPARVRAYLDRVNARFLAFDNDVMSGGIAPVEFQARWRRYYDAWARFVEAEGDSWFEGWSTGTVDEAERYENELRAWIESYEALGGKAGPKLDKYAAPEGGGIPVWAALAGGAGGLALLLAWWGRR